MIFNLGVFDRVGFELEGASMAVEIETDVTFEVKDEIKVDSGLEGPATGSTGSKNPINGADDVDS